jgi:SpoVK/Ycf46/Vps4 family AAA+-type ATPase
MSDSGVFSNFKDEGIKFLTEAIKEDHAENYVKALNLYTRGMEFLLKAIKYSKIATEKEILGQKVREYMARAEELKEATAAKEPQQPPGAAAQQSVEELPEIDVDAELSRIVGQQSIKDQLLAFRHQIQIDNRRKELGFEIESAATPHMMFQGNPGTGKTMIARLVAAVLRQLGLLSRGHLVEVQRADLVGSHIGETALKTRKKIQEAEDGVLFVDEAYTLTSASENDFGGEAVNEIMAAMLKGNPVMIFAGYPSEMDEFVGLNAGLFRRIEQQYVFEDYSVQDLAQIVKIKVQKSGFKLGEELTVESVAAIIDRHTTQAQRSRMNGGISDNMLRGARRNLDRRLTVRSTLEELSTYRRDDLVVAAKAIPQPPPATATAD